jgi:hypothetical protein
MPAKKKRQVAQSDMQRDFAAREEASRRAHQWAARCLAYRDADEPALAKDAEQKARHWLRTRRQKADRVWRIESERRGPSLAAATYLRSSDSERNANLGTSQSGVRCVIKAPGCSKRC